MKGIEKIGGILGSVEPISAEDNYSEMENIYNIGKITGTTKIGAIIGSIENIPNGWKLTSNSYYIPGTSAGAVNNIDPDGFLAKDFTVVELVNKLKEVVQNDKNETKLLNWKIENGKNKGYPIFEQQ